MSWIFGDKFSVNFSPGNKRLKICDLSGRFRHGASLAIPHRKSFAAIPSVSLVHLGRTNRCVSTLSHESQREIALV